MAKWLKATTSLLLLFVVVSCGPKRPEGTLVGVPDSPSRSSSLDSLLQGLSYIREHPTEREDERVQRFLWVDQWAAILESKNNLNADLGKEFWADLTNFVHEPPMSVSSLRTILERADTQLGRNVVNYQLYLSSLKTSSVEEAMSHLEFIEEDGISDLHRRAAQLLELQNVKEIAESRKVGVLIPLSGQFAPIGEQILTSIQIVSELALGEGIEFIIADTGETNDKLLESFQKLAIDENVSAIIGPVTTEATEFIFERAQILRVPVISLAPRENLEYFGGFNFRSTLTIGEQIRKLSDFIRRDLSARRVAVLFPDSAYGWDVIERAREIFNSQGIEITEMRVYSKDATDFKEELKEMTRLDFPKLRADELCPKVTTESEEKPKNCVSSLSELPPLYTFEVLFVPDFADKVGLILPTLPFLRMYGVQVVGLSGLSSPKLIERSQQSSEGLIFTDAFFEKSKDIQTQFFVERYSNVAKASPSDLAAEAFDASLVVVELMRRIEGPVTREEIVGRIARLRGFEGVTGKISTDGNQLKKHPRLMIVRNGEFQEFQ